MNHLIEINLLSARLTAPEERGMFTSYMVPVGLAILFTLGKYRVTKDETVKTTGK